MNNLANDILAAVVRRKRKAAGPTLDVLVWNVESFTRGKRPHWRGLQDRRVHILEETLDRHECDIAVILETGYDAATISVSGYGTIATPITGKNEPHNGYDGETYAILHREKRADGMALAVANVELVGNVDAEYRQAVYFTVNGKLAVAAIHAPSPGHPLDVRLGVIGECLRAAKAKAGQLPLVFCGDLNIKRDDLGALEQRMKEHDMTHGGPGCETTVRRNANALVTGWESQPYDQVWYHDPRQGHIPARMVIPPIASEKVHTIAQCYMDRFDNARLETARITAHSGPGRPIDQNLWAAADMIEADLLGLKEAAGLLEIRGWMNFVRRYHEKLAGAKAQPVTYDVENRCLQAYVNELLGQAQLLVLLIQHAAQHTDVRDALLLSNLMSDHFPVAFHYELPP